jgi:two-component system sensor histidine kinase KdpD
MGNAMDLGVNEPERRRFLGLRARGVVIAVVAPAAAGVASIPLARNGPAAAIALFLLAIVIAAVAGGLWAGLLAAVLSSLGLVFLSEAQRLALQLEGTEEAVSAVVFLTVALVVGILVGGAAEDRARASRREREARLLGHLSSRFVSGEVPDRVLDDFVRVLLEPFGLVSAEVHVELDGTQLHARAARSELTPGGPDGVVPLVVGPVSFGTLRVERPAGRKPLGPHEQLLLEAASKQASAALDRARLDARARLAQLDAETNQLRAAMFSSVTHDFRTPLASIKAGVTSLLDPSVEHDPAQERELLTTILEETDRLNRLVGNILDLARIRAGALIPARNEAGLDEIAEVVVARLVPRLGDVRVVLDIDDDVPSVAVDEMQLDQVMTNLLENAARHSPPGGEVLVSIEAVEDRVAVRVRDRGPGVPADDRERVFEAFYRGASIPDSPGTGLGLAIANAIVTAHGGRIWTEDTPGGGATFAFEIPIEAPSVQVPFEHAPPPVQVEPAASPEPVVSASEHEARA